DSHYGRREGEQADYLQWGRLLARAARQAYGGSTETIGSTGGREHRLLVLGGDLVNKADRQEEWDMFFKAGGEVLRSMRVITATGNKGKTRAVSYEDRFDLPANGPAGNERRFYSCDYGCCHFLVLDSNQMGPAGSDQVQTLQEWIRSDLNGSCQPVVFVIMHHPMVTMGTSPEDEERAAFMRRTYLPLLEDGGADMILCGHQHLYSRSRVLGAPAGGDPGLIQLMSVSGTKYFDGWDLSQMEIVCEYVSTATIFHVGQKGIRLKTIDPEGKVLDELERPLRPKNGRR
ncbi:MAG: metallophosphoesterase, partial [Firmicutes bacterium]|nr:metallophosphoesterase [Bacillota bacterium]